MRKRFKPILNHNSEFELDLAPLLAVMVKLVPVLIVSSAFVPIVIIQSELPAPVAAKSAVTRLHQSIRAKECRGVP